MEGEVAQMELLAELQLIHRLEHLAFQRFSLFVGLFLVEIDPMNLLGEAVSGSEIGLCSRDGRLDSLSGQLGEFQKVSVQFDWNERPFDLELEQIVVQGVDDVVQGLKKTHYVSPEPDKARLPVKPGLDLPAQELRLVLQTRHRLKVAVERLDIVVEIVLHALAENQQSLVDRVEELVDVTYYLINFFLV